MIERVLPVGVEVAEHAGPPLPAPLHPSEEAGVANAVPARRAEYAAVRECARTALRRLGPARPPSPPDPTAHPCGRRGSSGA